MKFGIIGNLQKPRLEEVTTRLLAYLHAQKIAYCLEEGLARWLLVRDTQLAIGPADFVAPDLLPLRCDVLIALGGDGTMLTAARIVRDRGTPIFGINLGKLGFMAEASADELEGAMDEILRNETWIDDRMVLRVAAGGAAKDLFALNDVVIDRGPSPRILNIEAFVDGDYLFTLSADGLIVSTPTGSTAYSLASGGPVIVPRSRVMEITPISPHTLSARTVVVPDTSVLTINIPPLARPVHLITDGQGEELYNPPVTFTVRKADYTINLIKRKKYSHFDILRTKLLWGSDVRLARDAGDGES